MKPGWTLATKYAWHCQHPLVKGGVKLVYLAIARRVRSGARVTTKPTSLAQLERLTGLKPAQIHRNIDVLEQSDVGEVRRLSRGKLAVYGLPKLAGPLFVLDSDDAVSISNFVFDLPQKPPEKIDHNDRKKIDHNDRFFARSEAVPAVPPLSVRTDIEVVPPTTEKKKAVEVALSDSRISEFLTWWEAVYPLYNAGALTTVRPNRDGPIVAELLTRRPAEHLKNLAAALWLVDAREEPWIAQSDRSVRVLRHKADWLDRRLTTVADWWVACPHSPKCRTNCQRAEGIG